MGMKLGRTVFENTELRTFGARRNGMADGCRKLHNEELHNVNSLPIIIKMVKSSRMRLAGHVARIGRERERERERVGR
jgi:hypothetical protein